MIAPRLGGLPPQFWKADPHKYGPGEIHLIHEDGDRTLCGRTWAQCPGKHVPATEYTCKSCAGVIASRERHARQQREYQQQQRERLARKAEEARVWRQRYEAYLRSPEWAKKRAAVMKRAKGWCEGCSERPANQVHHLTYVHLGDEPLFELAAICRECHEKITRMDQERRTKWYEAG